jgi:hypothetical protein
MGQDREPWVPGEPERRRRRDSDGPAARRGTGGLRAVRVCPTCGAEVAPETAAGPVEREPGGATAPLTTPALLSAMAALVVTMDQAAQDPESVARADAAISARLRLIDALCTAGWRPPPVDDRAMTLDSQLVRLRLGAGDALRYIVPPARAPEG